MNQTVQTGNVNEIDIWNRSQWLHANNIGIEPRDIKFCNQEWLGVNVHKQAPKVFKCTGNDKLWLSYHIHLQTVHKGDHSTLNDRFAVVVTHGHECDDPSKSVHSAVTQADCHSFEEFNAVMGEKCVRHNIVVNLFSSGYGCFIVYCTNPQTSCELWIRSYWNKFVNVFESLQTIKIGTQSISIQGENFASNVSLIKVQCMDKESRILPCDCTAVDTTTGGQATITFQKPLIGKHVGRIYLRLDCDNSGWLKPVPVAVLTQDNNFYIPMIVVSTFFLVGLLVTGAFCIFWRNKDRRWKFERRKKLADAQKLRDSQLLAEDALEFDVAGLH
mmetsp:Transcript_38179/g.62621  ORF Transcript_38179/g.62621 Transcript_38179/m.62621 type:complete len:330 (-) Transcript_38179:28-1017(-)